MTKDLTEVDEVIDSLPKERQRKIETGSANLRLRRELVENVKALVNIRALLLLCWIP